MVSFSFPPEYFCRKEDFDGLIYPVEEKEKRGRRLGIDQVVLLNFPEVRDMSATEFIDQILSPFHPSTIVVGYNFRFGKNRTGSTDFLNSYGRRHGFQTVVIPPVLFSGHKVSSSMIRFYLKTGEIQKANQFLGQPYVLRGQISREEELPARHSFFPYRFERQAIDLVKLLPGYYSIQSSEYGKGVLFISPIKKLKQETATSMADTVAYTLHFSNRILLTETLSSLPPTESELIVNSYLSHQFDRSILQALR